MNLLITSFICTYCYFYAHIRSLKMNLNGAHHQANDGDLCIADSGATHTILKSKKYFSELKLTKGTIDTISGLKT